MKNLNFIFVILAIFISTVVISCQSVVDDLGPVITYEGTVKEGIDTANQFTYFKQLYKYADSLSTAGRAANGAQNIFSATFGSKYVTVFAPNNQAFINAGITQVKIGKKINPALLNLLTNNLVAFEAATGPITGTNDAATARANEIGILSKYLGYLTVSSRVASLDNINSFITLNHGVAPIGVDSLFLFRRNGQITFNKAANVVNPQPKAYSNGYLFETDGLVIPPTFGVTIRTYSASQDTTLSLFQAAIVRAGTAANTPGGNFNAYVTVPAAPASPRVSTLFVPNNDAMRAAGYTTAAIIGAKPVAEMGNLIAHHLLGNQRLYTSDLVSGTTLRMVSGRDIKIASTTPTVTLVSPITGISNTSTIIRSNIVQQRCVIHKIDQILK